MAYRPVVLIADDDEATRNRLVQIFSSHGGFRIGGVAADGFAAAMMALELTPDVVVLDLFMPRWDGGKAAEFIHDNCPRAKVVALSAVPDERPEWAEAFVVKADVGSLIALVEELLFSQSAR